VLETLGAQLERNERNVRTVHGLERDAVRRAVEVGISDKVLDGFDKLHKKEKGMQENQDARKARSMQNTTRKSWSQEEKRIEEDS